VTVNWYALVGKYLFATVSAHSAGSCEAVRTSTAPLKELVVIIPLYHFRQANKENKILENAKSHIDEIVSTIEQESCYANPGPAAVTAGKYIDENFYLIPKSNFPTSYGTVGTLYKEGKPDVKATRDKGLELLVRAEQLRQEELKAKQKWRDERYEVYMSLPSSNPSMSQLDFEVIYGSFTRLQVESFDEIVRLKRELASKE
jgi:hypothetical protein